MSKRITTLVTALILALAAWLTTPATAAETPAPSASTTPPMSSTTPPMSSTPTPSPVAPSSEPVATAPATPDALPECEMEDGPYPCHWDASKSGNGKGRSYTIDPNGTTFYDDAPKSPAQGYEYAGEAHIWEGPTDGTGEAGIDSKWHDEYGFPKRENLPSCDRVGSQESCAGPGYRILVGADCSRMIVDDSGAQYLPTPGTEQGIKTATGGECHAITHQWPDDDTQGAGKDQKSAKDTKATKSARGERSKKQHEDKAGLLGGSSKASEGSASAAKASTKGAGAKGAVSDDEASDDATQGEVVAAPATTSGPGGSLAQTGVPMDFDFWVGLAAIAMFAGWLIVTRNRPGRRIGRHGH